MKHPNEDTLLKSVLALLSADEEGELRSHLSQCTDCSRFFQRLSREVEKIGCIEPTIATNLFPLPRKRRNTAITWLKIASLLVLGFGAGHTVSRFTQPEQIHIVPHYLEIHGPEVSLASMSSCTPVDMAVDPTWTDEASPR
jgi:hypothetical protein